MTHHPRSHRHPPGRQREEQRLTDRLRTANESADEDVGIGTMVGSSWSRRKMTTRTPTTAETVRADIEPREPRCRICRDPVLRRLVNDLLSNWHGVPVFLEGRRTRRISYTQILRTINEGRDKKVTYDNLWNHAKRHHDLDAIVDYWTAWLYRELRRGLGGRRNARPIE